MSISASRAYFRARANSLSFKEWKDGFNIENIPSTVINKSYHITQGIASGIKLNQNDQEIGFPITVELFVKGFKDVSGAIDYSIELTEDLIATCIAPANRLTQTTGIKNIIFENASFEPLDNSNDNSVIAKVTFRVFTILGL